MKWREQGTQEEEEGIVKKKKKQERGRDSELSQQVNREMEGKGGEEIVDILQQD